MIKFDGSTSYALIPKEVLGDRKIFTIELSLRTAEKKNNSTYWHTPTIIGSATPGSSSGECNMTISEGYLACWEGITSDGDVYAVSSYYVADNEIFNCAIICDGSIVKFLYKNKIFAQWNIYRGINNVDSYLGSVVPQGAATTSCCQMDLYRCKIYSTAKDINDLYTDSDRDNLLVSYGNKVSGNILINEANSNYNATMYNCIYKNSPNTIYSNLKTE